MPKTKLQKEEILRTLTEKIKQSKSIVFTSFNALGVKDNEALRSKLREENGEYYVAKKTLLELAFKDQKIEGLEVRGLDGKVAAVFSYGDEVAPTKALFNFSKDKGDKIVFLGGILDNKFLDQAAVESLAKLPGKLELQAKLVGSLNAPISGFVNVMAGNLRGLVTVLKAIEGTKA